MWALRTKLTKKNKEKFCCYVSRTNKFRLEKVRIFLSIRERRWTFRIRMTMFQCKSMSKEHGLVWSWSQFFVEMSSKFTCSNTTFVRRPIEFYTSSYWCVVLHRKLTRSCVFVRNENTLAKVNTPKFLFTQTHSGKSCDWKETIESKCFVIFRCHLIVVCWCGKVFDSLFWEKNCFVRFL